MMHHRWLSCCFLLLSVFSPFFAGMRDQPADIPLPLDGKAKLLYAWIMPDQTIIVFDRTSTRLVRVDREGHILKSVALEEPALGPYKMNTITGGFVEGKTLWVSDITPKLVNWSIDLKPLKAVTIPTVYYVGSIRKQGNTLWVGGEAPQDFYLTPGWHLFKYTWPDLKLQYRGLGTPNEEIEFEKRTRMGGLKMIALAPNGIVYMVSHTFPALIEHDLKTEKTRVRKLEFWSRAWVEPKKERETPKVYALSVEYLDSGYIGIQIYDNRGDGNRYVLELVRLTDDREFLIKLPGRLLEMDHKDRWLFQLWNHGKTFLGWRQIEGIPRSK